MMMGFFFENARVAETMGRGAKQSWFTLRLS
jgi:hypothetical protein